MASLLAAINKDQPSPGDVHVGTALGNERGHRRRRLFKPFVGGGNKPVDVGDSGAGGTMGKASTQTPAVNLKPLDDDTVHTPFLYDAHAFDRLREDQKPRFLGAVSSPGRLPLRTIYLDDVVAVQNRIDPAKIEAMRGARTMVGRRKPVVTRFADRDYIADGHHRLTAAMLDGQKEFEVHYLDLTRESNALKSAGAVWSIPLEIAKADPDRQMIFGWASVVTKNGKPIIDKQGDQIPVDELEKAAYDYVLESRDQGDMHRRTGVGKLIESMVFTAEKQAALGIDLGQVGWFVGFKVTDADLWAAHKRGERPEFSIGGVAYPEEMSE